MTTRRNSRWLIRANAGIDALQFEDNIPIPEISGKQCLIRIEAASLNYRDIAMATDRYIWQVAKSFVPVSDGCGQIIAIGDEVNEFQVGDKVCMSFMQDHQDGIITPPIRASSLGSQRDGVLQHYGIFEETGLVCLPKHLTSVEGSTLPCAAVTAWNCLFGLHGKSLQKGEILLTQGTGGVSLFAIQFALAIGATVISTTSSPEKAKRLKELGVHHVINYQDDSNWGDTAKALSEDGLGVHHVVEVGGETTISQSISAVRPEGVISLVGFLGGKSASPTSFGLVQQKTCIVRGINVGSRKLFREMNSFLEDKGIKPVVSDRIFDFHSAKEAYHYMDQQEFFGKIVIKVD
ncbi:alcohol dehydrogenase [Exophiala viscosa]|uniref:Alcohol dehydrogenase n=1 Tax=Exophiala viscosa TaxID=2486360 RepID=A0AAN6DNV3_9EURO|nr:alcohol dehydrogenase [Exophiala viscosa]KAI1620222.1 alcohol dehydrogenase [Exophiala viscosa]